MPSSGLPIEHFWKENQTNEEVREMYAYIELQAEHSIKMGVFMEWLESFVGAWNSTKDPVQAANAGIIEWDM